jgi:hypothetical protein
MVPLIIKTVWNYVNDYKKSKGMHELTEFVPCPIDTVHNGFIKGLNVFGEDAEELALHHSQLFKSNACQREDYSMVLDELNLEETMFIRHVQCT